MKFYLKIKQVSWTHLLPDILLIIISLYLSLFLRVGGTSDFYRFLPTLHKYLPLFIVIRITTFIFMDIYSILWRYVTTQDAFKLLKATLLSSSFVLAIAMLAPQLGPLPRSIFFIDAILLTSLLMGARIARRLLYENSQSPADEALHVKTLIVGAGQSGKILAQRFHSEPSLNVNLIGFVDDDPKKMGRSIAGTKVLGSLEHLESLIENNGIKKVIIAISQLQPETLKSIFSKTRAHNILPQVIVDQQEDSPQNSKAHHIYRHVSLNDLLQRAPRKIDLKTIKEMIQGRSVLITGAGGSIGSEIARQVLPHEPKHLLLLDHSEYNLFKIDQELRLSTHDLSHVVPLLVDIKNYDSLKSAIERYQPEIILHAAAYKHVHLVETSPHSAILNNVMGTHNLLELAKDFNTKIFVNISTDKAVNPAGVMGATKRICEIMVTSAALETQQQFCSVRFGNVLGSSGSLIPILKEQIQSGGPITITHKDMTRYFMLIPEAVKLVLMAAAQSQPGDINVLKMGDPVKIVDIAKNLITLMGHDAESFPIVYTGLRPGEKMFEELYIRGDELHTSHPDILSIPNGDIQSEDLSHSLKSYKNKILHLIEKAQKGHEDSLNILAELVQSNYKSQSTSIDGKTNASNLINAQRSLKLNV